MLLSNRLAVAGHRHSALARWALIPQCSRWGGCLRPHPTRLITSTTTGAMVQQPISTPLLGMLRLFMAVVPGLWIGATISKTCAAFLEENDIFVPSDDDDDD